MLIVFNVNPTQTVTFLPDEMCFKILDEDDELSDDALEPGEENELEGVEFFDEEFFAAEELSC